MKPDLFPVLSNPHPDDAAHSSFSSSTMLPSFPSLRERNMRTLYDDTIVSDYTDSDKSPKGSVDKKIRPLVDLINRHPEYVTLSSCSGRVALFDPAGVVVVQDDKSDNLVKHETDDKEVKLQQKGTKISGKGRGKWIFVTHDILPDEELGLHIIQSLQKVGQERQQLAHQATAVQSNDDATTTISNDEHPPITFKHEPPLLHVAAASLAAGKKLLHIAKSTCAMRESGLVVTDQRVTVELRTTGTLLCLPLMVQLVEGSMAEKESIELVPNEQYLQLLAVMANERMVQNEMLLTKLFAAVQDDLFVDSMSANGPTTTMRNDKELEEESYKVTLQPLPQLNIWKSAAVAIPRNADRLCRKGDLDVLALGGQGIGPDLDMDGTPSGKAPACKRWDAVFRLARRNGVWSDRWDTITSAVPPKIVANSYTTDCSLTEIGGFRVQLTKSLGAREGHCVCILPDLKTGKSIRVNHSMPVILFGGRTGGPSSPSNDLFLFEYSFDPNLGEELGMFGIPIDTRGNLPEPRYGHTMTALQSKLGPITLQDGDPIAVVAGGTGINSGGNAVSLSSVYVLSRITEDDSGLSHFIWDRVSDMPSPRSYHTAFMVDSAGSILFVFGGIPEADDPFGSLDDNRSDEKAKSSWFEVPLFGEGDKSHEGYNMSDFNELTPLVGSSAAALTMRSGGHTTVLLTGGTKLPAHDSSESYTKAQHPLNILTLQRNKGRLLEELTRAEISSIELLNNAEFKEEGSSDIVDFGSCVHHCLVPLPKGKDNESSNGNGTGSAIIIGGGVPSFSFGQSYARSFFVSVNCAEQVAKCNKIKIKQLRNHNFASQPKSPLVEPKSQHTINGKSMVEVDVIYISPRHAKEVKNELESLGYLDKRYKMVKVERRTSNSDEDEGMENLIAIPITKQCIELVTSMPAGSHNSSAEIDKTAITQQSLSKSSFQHHIQGAGSEMVPYSASSTGRMKQRKGVR